MEQCDNIYDQIQQLLGNMAGTVSILEEQIDADVQLEYYNYSQHLTKRLKPEDVLKNRDVIFKKDTDIEYKKHYMIQLAGIDSIEAYRTLEKYSNVKNNQLRDWAMLAMQECRLLLESKLLDQNQILISTGLGGKGLKLRYFAVFIGFAGKAFTAFQKKIIEAETAYAIKKCCGEIEKVRFSRELSTILCMIPLHIPVQKLFDDIISECNHYGDFIHNDYIITNVKIIPDREVREMIECSKLQQKTRIH